MSSSVAPAECPEEDRDCNGRYRFQSFPAKKAIGGTSGFSNIPRPSAMVAFANTVAGDQHFINPNKAEVILQRLITSCLSGRKAEVIDNELSF